MNNKIFALILVLLMGGSAQAARLPTVSQLMKFFHFTQRGRVTQFATNSIQRVKTNQQLIESHTNGHAIMNKAVMSPDNNKCRPNGYANVIGTLVNYTVLLNEKEYSAKLCIRPGGNVDSLDDVLEALQNDRWVSMSLIK